MPDDLKTFAPTPQRITFVIQGTPVQTELYNFLDLPVKDALAVYTLEDEMRAAPGGFPEFVGYLRKIVALLCPRLEPEQIEALVPRHLQDALAASHGVTLPPPGAEGGGAASPSPSAPSTTRSP